jgi:hypothetical protein
VNCGRVKETVVNLNGKAYRVNTVVPAETVKVELPVCVCRAALISLLLLHFCFYFTSKL